jgi:hypothetical protein
MAHLSRHQFKTHLQKAFSAARHLKPTSCGDIACFSVGRKILLNAQNKEQNSTPLINTSVLCVTKVSLAAVRGAEPLPN